MKIERLPIRLGAEPLLEAVCEMRFTSSHPAPNVLPGLLLRHLHDKGHQVSMQPLPASSFPKEVRDADPALRDAPMIALKWNSRTILIGETMITVSCGKPYPGWKVFREEIQSVFRVAADSNTITLVNRFSLKYVDLIPSGNLQRAGGLDIKLKLGELELDRHNAVIRIEINDPPFLHVINAMTVAEAIQDGAAPIRGSLVDVDTLSVQPAVSVQDFMSRLFNNLDDAHSRNKRTFFECLTQETLSKLEPIYE